MSPDDILTREEHMTIFTPNDGGGGGAMSEEARVTLLTERLEFVVNRHGARMWGTPAAPHRRDAWTHLWDIQFPDCAPHRVVEYIHADAHHCALNRIAELEAQVKQLTEALRRVGEREWIIASWYDENTRNFNWRVNVADGEPRNGRQNYEGTRHTGATPAEAALRALAEEAGR